MQAYEKSMLALEQLFGKDCTFVLATANNNIPSARVVDTYYEDGAFWVVTYANSTKGMAIAANPNVALCNNFHTFSGKATNMGHPLKEENAQMRQTLMREFEPWYLPHNNEDDPNMCFVKIVPTAGFFHKDGTGYRVDFEKKEVAEVPFAPDV